MELLAELTWREAAPIILGVAAAIPLIWLINKYFPVQPFNFADFDESDSFQVTDSDVSQELAVRLSMHTGEPVVVNWNGSGYDVDLNGETPPEWLRETFRGYPINIIG